MATFDDLDDRQRALLQLLLKQGKSYDEIAALLKSDASAVQARAHAAVAALGPDSPDIGAEHRGELADYLLGQQSACAAPRPARPRGLRRRARLGARRGRVAAALGRRHAARRPGGARGGRRGVPGAARADGTPGGGARRGQLGTRILFGAAGLIVAIVLIVALGVFGDDEPKPTTSTVTRTAPTTTPETPQIILQRACDRRRSDSAARARPRSSATRPRTSSACCSPASSSPGARGLGIRGLAVHLGVRPAVRRLPKATVSEDGKLEVVADLTPRRAATARSSSRASA